MSEVNDKNIFKRLALLFRGYEFNFFLLIIYLLVLSWPFMASLNKSSVFFSFVFYFGAWAVLVILLLVSNLIAGDSDNNDD
jgi:hypothetical protein